MGNFPCCENCGEVNEKADKQISDLLETNKVKIYFIFLKRKKKKKKTRKNMKILQLLMRTMRRLKMK